MTNRKAGFYWVKDGLGWEPLRWSGCVWDGHLNDADLEEVGQRIPEPDEPWQCVPVEPTDEMTKASTWSGNGDVSVSEEWARKTVYGRMLSAAPRPEDV